MMITKLCEHLSCAVIHDPQTESRCSPDPNNVLGFMVEQLQAVEDDIDNLGGLETYQRMSNIGQGNDRGGGSEKIFVGWLNELSEPQKLREDKRQYKYVVIGRIPFFSDLTTHLSTIITDYLKWEL